MPEPRIDDIYDYDQTYLADILKSVKTIAMVGASADKTKFSYGVLRVLHETGYDMIPVNPNPNLTEIRGIKPSSFARRDRPPR
jgi:predicted CoA-binding protein